MPFVCVLISSCIYGQPPAKTFTLKEQFGVSHPEQPVEFRSSGRPETPNTRMLGPNGDEVPYQQLSSGNILVRTALPASRISCLYRVAGIDPQHHTITIDLGSLSQAYPASGDAVRFEGQDLPIGVDAGVDYFLKRISPNSYQLSRGKNLRDTVGIGSVGEAFIRRQGWIVDPDDPRHTLYAKGHGYQTGDPIRLKSSGILPAPLKPDQNYFVIRRDSDTFELAATLAAARSGNAITLRTLGTGIFETTVEWTWRLAQGGSRSANVSLPVKLHDSGGTYEITNGLTGVRVTKRSGHGSTFNKAPIQGVQLADKSWLATGPNYLYESYTKKLAGFLTSYSLSIIESGPLLVRVLARYGLNRPEYTYGSGHPIIAADLAADTLTIAGNSYWNTSTSLQFRSDGGTLPCGLSENNLYWPVWRSDGRNTNQTSFKFAASKNGAPIHLTCGASGHPRAIETMNLPGKGFFEETISLYAGQKSILIEDDTDAQLQYFLNFYKAGIFVPDQARYRGHVATDISCGYSLQGSRKVPYVPYTEALVDVSYTAAKDSSYVCSPTTLKFAPVWYMPNSGRNTGWYWQLYVSSDSVSSPLIGYYIGRESRYVTPIYAGPGIYTSPNHFASANGAAAGITMHVGFRGPDGRSAQRTRREWGIYVSTKSDLRDPTQIQPIGVERNVIAGINLTHLATYVFEFPDPPGGWPLPYRSRESYLDLVRQVRSERVYRDYIDRESPETRDLVRMWTGSTRVDTEAVVSNLEQFAHHWDEILVNGNGNFDSWWHYYQPGLVWEPLLARVMAVLTSNVASISQKLRAKAVAAFAASIFWDDDYVPWDQDTMEGIGNPNQGLQFAAYRAQNAIALSTQPLMARSQRLAREYIEASYLYYLNPNSGVPRGSTHYQAAAMDPALTNFLDLKNSGVNLNGYPLWNGYSRWLLNALTPPEPRFGNVRKMVSVGDGNTEATAMHGMVATLLRDAAPSLSAQLQWGWTSQNSATTKTYGQFSMPSILVIDDRAPAENPHLKSADYIGYWSVLRHGFDTPNETAAWFINGDHYSDHRHAESGQVSIYALSAPLAIDWNANLYYPQVPGGIQHNRIVREAEIGMPWNADNLPLGAVRNWGPAGPTRFSGFDYASRAETDFVAADGTTWTRSATMLAPDPRHPLIYVLDRFAGTGALESKVLTWNLMATGAVATPAGRYVPVERLNVGQSQQPNALPSSGPDYLLNRGLQHFQFTGQPWVAHPTQGIDWDLYLISDGAQRFYIGNWGHSAHSAREMNDYQRANGSPFHERQHILRVKSTGTFVTIFLPYRKGEVPERKLTEEACGVRISAADQMLCFSDHGYEFSDVSRKILARFDNTPETFGGMTVAGGPTELVMTDNRVTIIPSGPSGLRTITLAGKWNAPNGVHQSGAKYVLQYKAGARARFELKRQTPR